jgi:flagellar motor switch protein FliM
MSEVLTQDEINQLLLAISGDDDDNEEKIVQKKKKEDYIKWKYYDFTRPNTFSKLEILLILQYFESLSHKYKEVKIASVDQLTFQEFSRTIPTPTLLLKTNVNNLKNIVIQIEEEVDKIDNAKELNKFALNHRFTKLSLEFLRYWEKLLLNNDESKLLKNLIIGTDIHAFPLNHSYSDRNGVCITFEITTKEDKEKGGLNLGRVANIWVPEKLVKAFLRKEFEEFEELYVRQNDKKEKIDRFELNSYQIPVQAVLGRAKLSVEKIKNLEESTILLLDTKTNEEVEIVDVTTNKLIAKGEVIVNTNDDKYAIRITSKETK